MTKPKIALYYDLPPGGAKRLMDGLATALGDLYQFERLPTYAPSPNRLVRDRQNFFDVYLYAHQLANYLKNSSFSALLVGADPFFAAPALLCYSPVPSLLYCQEPTRALFEPELGIDPTLPFLNQTYEALYRTIKKILETKNARKATLISGNSRYSAQYIEHAYHRPAAIVYPGVDTHFFCPPKQQPHGPKSVLVVGNDEPQKRLSLAVLALSKLPKTLRPRLVLVSPRTLPGRRIINLAKRHGVQLDMRVGVSDQELRELYQRSSLTLITALAEPFGLSAAESLSCATPVVATNEGGVREIVQDGVSGYLTDNTPLALSQAMKKILTNKKLAYQLGQAGREHVISHFDWDQTTACMADLLNSLVKPRQLPQK